MENILFLDIETVACVSDYHLLSERKQTLWSKKASHLPNKDGLSEEELFKKRAGIYAEFGKIVAIALGVVKKKNGNGKPLLRIKALSSDNEFDLLTEFKWLLERFDQRNLHLCAHNGLEFDFPYLCRRMLINGISLPSALNLSGKKPWEVKHIDTLQLWKFGDYKNYTSLDMLAEVFDIEGSKDGIDGSMVNQVYYEGDKLEKIADYCRRDVLVLVQVYQKLNSLEIIEAKNVTMS